jgi:hypothetical protein
MTVYSTAGMERLYNELLSSRLSSPLLNGPCPRVKCASISCIAKVTAANIIRHRLFSSPVRLVQPCNSRRRHVPLVSSYVDNIHCHCQSDSEKQNDRLSIEDNDNCVCRRF